MNNPPAFPAQGYSTFGGQGLNMVYAEGMTLRDYFAAKAMQGLMSGRWKSDINGTTYDAYRADADQWAKSAYHFADAMLKAREA
jgi:hypothetical protein